MGKTRTKESLLLHKESAISALSGLLEELIYAGDSASLKKADLLCYWFKDYASYISSEEAFDPTSLLSYKRGNILQVNFGFRVGTEYGGLHFAVVLDKHNAYHSKNVTVVPLSSSDGRKVHPQDLDLGSELHFKLSASNNRLLQNASNRIAELEENVSIFSNMISTLEGSAASAVKEVDDNMLKQLYSALSRNMQELEEWKELHSFLSKEKSRIASMKNGSIAKISQITTISKQRIYTPKKYSDSLSGVSLSKESMEKLNEKIKDSFIF